MAEAIRPQVHGAFPTPLATLEIADAARLNAELRATILTRMESHPTTRHSNLGGWQSSWDFADWGGPAGKAALEQAQDLASRLTCDRQGRPIRPAWRLNAWANVNGPGHGNEFHTHPGCFWSGTYYVDDGGAGADPALGGEFEFQDPRGVAPAMYAPHLAFSVPGGLACGASETLRPRSGLMVLFPAWLSHAVRPYRGDALRISIAFNLSV